MHAFSIMSKMGGGCGAQIIRPGHHLGLSLHAGCAHVAGATMIVGSDATTVAKMASRMTNITRFDSIHANGLEDSNSMVTKTMAHGWTTKR